jgi:hypothetical protein
MDIETHWITLVSIIIGLGLAKMLGNLHRLIDNRARVRWDALPLAWTMTTFFLVLNYWWAVYLRLDGSERARTAGEFGLLLTPALLLFLASASVLPEFASDDDWDMPRRYKDNRMIFIVTVAAYQVSTFVAALVLGSVAPNLTTMIRFAVFACVISLLLIKSRLWDWVVVLTAMGLLLVRLNTELVK